MRRLDDHDRAVERAGRNGELAVAEPTFDGGGAPGRVGTELGQAALVDQHRRCSAPTACGSRTRAFRSPASPASWWIVAVIGRFCPGLVGSGPAERDPEVGENGSAAQLVDVYSPDPVTFWVGFAYESAVNFVVLVPHEVGLRMKPWPPTVPLRLMSSELMSVGTLRARPRAWAMFGMSLSTVLRPKSLLRSFTSEIWMIFWKAGSGSEPTGRSTIPNRAGSPVGALDVVQRAVHGQRQGQRQGIGEMRRHVGGHRADLAGARTGVALELGQWCRAGSPSGRRPCPAGRPTVRSLTSSVAPVKPMWMLTSLCAPAFGFVGRRRQALETEGGMRGGDDKADRQRWPLRTKAMHDEPDSSSPPTLFPLG